MSPAQEDLFDEAGGGRADLPGPIDDPRRGPFQMSLMGGGHMLLLCGMCSLLAAAQMAGDAYSLMETLHGRGRDPHLDLFPDQSVWNAVVVARHLDVVVDVHPGLPPFDIFVPILRQRLQRRPIERLEEAAAAAFHLFEGAVIEFAKQFQDSRIQLGKTEEGAVAKPREDPTLDD